MFTLNAEAKMKYLKNFKVMYPKTKLSECMICHTGDAYARNSYGEALEKNQNNFKAIEAEDSDGDGVNNITEINAGTGPGDKSSVPLVEGAVVEAVN
jgi:hypothetical protein